MTTTHLLYLHGFRSSPLSAKAQQMARHMAQHHPSVHWWCPQLPPSPKGAMHMVAQGIAQWPRDCMGVIGSSLGGFYASWVASQTGCPSVLLNPAVEPARDLCRSIGEQTTWQNPGERFYFLPEYIDELKALDASHQAPLSQELAIIAKGDEVLDWREMTARYPKARQILLEGGSHALENFADYIPQITAFLELAQPSHAG